MPRLTTWGGQNREPVEYSFLCHQSRS